MSDTLTIEDVLQEAESCAERVGHRWGLLSSSQWERIIRLAYEAGKRDGYNQGFEDA